MKHADQKYMSDSQVKTTYKQDFIFEMDWEKRSWLHKGLEGGRFLGASEYVTHPQLYSNFFQAFIYFILF